LPVRRSEWWQIFVPGTEYSDANHWEREDTMPLRYDEELSIDGHMPFGVTGYPHEKEQKSFLEKYLLIIGLVIVLLLVIALVLIRKRKK
jgi:hypothetical protein